MTSKFIQPYTVEETKTIKLHHYIARRVFQEYKISVFKFGGQWRFDTKEIEEWERKQKSISFIKRR